MNYEPNKTHWNVGDIVLHDADEKSPRMVMRVIGYNRQGLCLTRYILGGRKRTQKIYANELRFLHNPEKFGIRQAWGRDPGFSWESAYGEWGRVRWWNHRHKPGTAVITLGKDRGITVGRAYLDDSGQASVYLVDGGRWLLKFVQPVGASYRA